MGREMQRSKEQDLGGKARSEGGLEGCRAVGLGRGGMGTVGGSLCSRKRGSAGHRTSSSLEGDMTSKVARSPEEVLLYLFSPGPAGCFSAALLLPVTSSSLVGADASAASQMSIVHADGRARYQNLPPKGVMQPGASSDPLPFPPAGLLAEGAAGEPSCKSSVVK